MDISIFGGKEEILKRRRKVPDYGVYNWVTWKEKFDCDIDNL